MFNDSTNYNENLSNYMKIYWGMLLIIIKKIYFDLF